MRRAGRAVAAFVMVVIGSAILVVLLPPIVWADNPAPSSIAPFVGEARRSLWNEATDGLALPLHLRFVDARCGADGTIALIFEEHRPPWLDTTFAYAARGSAPVANGAWAGGFGVREPVLADAELVHLIGADPGLCP